MFAQHAGGICSTCISCETCSSSINGGEVGKKCVKIPYNQLDTFCGTPNNPLKKEGYLLVFQDEFENELDTIHQNLAKISETEIIAKGDIHTRKMKNGQNVKGTYPKWRVWDGKMNGNNPESCADADNIHQQNGRILLQITQNEQDSPKYKMAAMQSNAFVRFGYIEAKVKIPKGKSFWPSMWLYSSYSDKCIYQEIDIMEFLQNGTIDGDVFAGSVGHNGNKGTTWRYSSGRIMKKAPNCNKLNSKGFYVYPYIEGCGAGLKKMVDLSKDYFIYAAEWSNDSIVYYLNNTRIYAIPSDSNMSHLPMCLILGTGMLNGHGHSNILCKDNLPNEYTLFPNDFSVEYVRIYKKENTFEEMLSLFPDKESIQNQSLVKIPLREFYPENDYLLQLFDEKGNEVEALESGYEESKYDTLLFYKLPQNLQKGNYYWQLTLTLFDGTIKKVKKNVRIM